MELSSPYLQAIQAIPGIIPGEKYRQLNLIAKTSATRIKSHGDSAAVAQVADVPQPLVPLLQLEIANVLRNYEGIVEALKSEDSVVLDRALSRRWFFRGDNEQVISIEYFEKNLLSYVSLNTRNQLVKRLASNLRASGKTEIANKFYTHLAKKYGKKQAEPLLAACDETFIYDTITTNKIVLSCRAVKILFVRYPKLIIRYMKLSKTKNDASCDSYNIDLCLYNLFLPRLIKNHPKDFVELITKHDSSLGIRLSGKASATLLKSSIEAVLENPEIWVQLMPLKVIASKLTKPQYKSMFLKLLPKDKQLFNYDAVKSYLEYYPEQERMELVMDSYKEVYAATLLDNTEAINVDFLCMLPAEERTKQARIKLEKEPDWQKNRRDVKRAWRCYLPIEESIPLIKIEITKTSSTDDRASLLSQMFYACKVNDDKEALLETLRYFTTRHKNEQSNVIFEVLGHLTDYFDLWTLSDDHWTVLNGFIKFLQVKGELMTRQVVTKKILVAGVLYNLNHDLPIEDKMMIIMEINIKGWKQPWSIVPKHPEYDRLCLDMFLTMIPKKYPRDDAIWKNRQQDVIESIVKSMYEFNTRNARANCTIDKLSIKSYPWLFEAVRGIVQSEGLASNSWQVLDIISILKIHEKDLYKEWIVVAVQEIVNVETGEALNRLAINSKNILDNWNEYLKLARQFIYRPSSQRFIRATRWYQEIPIKFADRCHKDVVNDADASSMVVLGILMEGSEVARVIEPFVPKNSTIDIQDENSKLNCNILHAIPEAMNIANPPVPLSLIIRFCDADYLSLGLTSLTNVCRRVSVDKVEIFAKTLTDRRVSVRKHGIRLFCLVASIDDLRTFVTDLWKNERHRSIRAVIFENIFKVFTVQEPSPDTWSIMKNCIADLTVDDSDCLDKLMEFDAISERFIADYVKQILETLEKLEANGFGEERTAKYISRVLDNLDHSRCNHLPEDFCEQLVQKFFCNPRLHEDVRSAGKRYVIYGYLGNALEKLDSRLVVFCSMFENMLKKNWNVPHHKDSSYFPINHLAHDFMMNLTDLGKNYSDVKIRIMESILKSFLAVLKPECDWLAYAALTYGIALKDVKTTSEIAKKIIPTLSPLIESLSPDIVTFLPEVATNAIKLLVDEAEVQPVLLDIMERLCRIGTKHACLFSAKLLFSCHDRELRGRLIKLFNFLRDSEYTAVACLAYQHINDMHLGSQ